MLINLLGVVNNVLSGIVDMIDVVFQDFVLFLNRIYDLITFLDLICQLIDILFILSNLLSQLSQLTSLCLVVSLQSNDGLLN